MRVTALAGGAGAAKFLQGLALAMAPEEITIISNTGDDAVIHGLSISPDIDIVTYTLAGIVDTSTGWGIAGDTTRALVQMARLGAQPWFTLKDADIGTHLARTEWLLRGHPLSEITGRIRRALGVGCRILPMSDDAVRTRIITAEGIEREFQDYFVAHHHEEEPAQVSFAGAEQARPGPGVLEAIEEAERIIICPSNPVVSIGPILAVPGIREAIESRRADVTAISPIVQGAALKGPAARLIPLWGAEVSASGVAGIYRSLAATFVADLRDPEEFPKIEALGMRLLALETVMTSPAVAAELAAAILAA